MQTCPFIWFKKSDGVGHGGSGGKEHCGELKKPEKGM